MATALQHVNGLQIFIGVFAYLFAVPFGLGLIIFTLLEAHKYQFLLSFLGASSLFIAAIFLANAFSAALWILGAAAIFLSVRLLRDASRTSKTLVLCSFVIFGAIALLVNVGPLGDGVEVGSLWLPAFLFLLLSPAVFARLIYRSIELRRLRG